MSEPVHDPSTAGTPPGPPTRLWVVAGILAVVAVVAIALLVISTGDDGDDGSSEVATGTSAPPGTDQPGTDTAPTTAEASDPAPTTATTVDAPGSTSTEAPEGPTTEPTEPTAPPVTADPAQCRDVATDTDPEYPAQAVFVAWTRGDRACAQELMSDEALGQLFARDGSDATDVFQGCSEVDDGDPHFDCAFSYEGGSTHFRMRYSPTVGWQVFEVYQVAD
jgi:hypothetical protein